MKRSATGDPQSAFIGVSLAVGSADGRPFGRTEDGAFFDETFRSRYAGAFVIQMDIDPVFFKSFTRCGFKTTFVVVSLAVAATDWGVNGWAYNLCGRKGQE